MANNCKVFTPNEYVVELLDYAKYKNHLYGASVLENSCGDGFVLIEIVKRYIKSCLKENLSLDIIRKGLEDDICGVELEEKHADQCKINLDRVAADFEIYNVNWNIIKGNYLTTDLQRQFQFVIGNPPYIVYRDIEEKERDYLKENFQVCFNGKFDYYYAFIEKGYYDLVINGKLAYIIPTSIYKNVFAHNLREFIKPYISELYDYSYKTKFPGVTTSSTVFILDKCKKSKQLVYKDMMKNEVYKISKNKLGVKWNFCARNVNEGSIRFGDYFNVSNTIATLCNKAFLLEQYLEDDNFYYINDKPIEKEIVCNAISRKKGINAKNIRIIFPYRFMSGQLMKYEEEEFKTKFPCAAEYLYTYIDDLKKRNADKTAKWFEYGRSQAISNMNQRKMVIPSILSSTIEATIIDEYVIPCAGFYITVKGEYSLEQAKLILESKKFYEYLDEIGIFTTGKSRRVSVHDIEDYTFNEWEG